MIQEHTCEKCKVITRGIINLGSDLKRVLYNKQLHGIYDKEMVRYPSKMECFNVQKQEIKRMVEDYNKNRHIFENKWELKEDSYAVFIIDQKNRNMIPLIMYKNNCLPKPHQPKLALIDTEYIECPTCKHKHYIKIDEE